MCKGSGNSKGRELRNVSLAFCVVPMLPSFALTAPPSFPDPDSRRASPLLAPCFTGNCVKQWSDSYNPSRKRRLAQAGVDANAAYMSQRAGEADSRC